MAKGSSARSRRSPSAGASGDDRGRNAQLAAAMVNQMSQPGFSRNDESEADHFGLAYG